MIKSTIFIYIAAVQQATWSTNGPWVRDPRIEKQSELQYFHKEVYFMYTMEECIFRLS